MKKFRTFENDQISMENNSKKSRLKKVVAKILIYLLVVAVSFVLGYIARRATFTCGNRKTYFPKNEDHREKIHEDIVSSIDTSKIKENLRFFAGMPHMASFDRNNLLGEDIYKRFIMNGFKAEKVSYDVLLSFPSPEKVNVVSIYNLNGTLLFKTNVSKENLTGVVPPFNAYSPKGNVEGEPIYLNYGRVEDFEKLNDLGVNCSGKIVIVRYGKNARGSKVELAEKYGAIGVIIYSDPEESGPVNDDELFPKSKWLPRSGVQRGTIKYSYGDPLTDGYPAKDWVYRLEPGNAGLPKIPTQPISAYDALNIMKEMDGVVVPKDWKGKLNITDYRLTGSKKVRIEVYNENVIRTITNIIGTIEGCVEPDRYVMLGNHRDAWAYGAVDSSSGTSIMMEMARVIGEMLKKGWVPRRTIKLMSWDGEEHGLLGSNEYVEEFLHDLRNHGVAYLNLDPAIFGSESLLAIGSGLVRDVIWESAKKVVFPGSKETVYDRMLHYTPNEGKNLPIFGGLTSASDYTTFYCLAGVTSANFKFGSGETFVTYHTEYDTLEWIENFADPGYKAHLAYSQVLTHILLRISDSLLIPFDAVVLSETLKEKSVKLITDITQKDSTFDASHLINAVNNFGASSIKLKKLLEDKHKREVVEQSQLPLRIVNDIIMQIEKLFLRDNGLPGREKIKNYISAPAATNKYGSSMFPSILDSLYQVKSPSSANNTKEWNVIKKEVTLVTLTIESCAQWIERGVYILTQTQL